MPRRRDRRHQRRWGEGTIYRAGRSWVARLWRQLDGSRPSRSFPSAAEAEDWIAKQRGRLNRGLQLDAPDEALGDYLAHWYERRAPMLGKQTRPGYRQAILCIGRVTQLPLVPLEKLQPEHFQALWAELLEPREPDRQPLAQSTLARIRTVLNGALQAVVPRIIDANPLRGAPTPRVELHAVEYWSEPDANRFLAVSDPTRFGAFFRVALTHGPRPSELRALQWQDIDFAGRTLTIERSMTEYGKMVGPTKTKRPRTIDLAEASLQLLQQLRGAQTVASPWVFCHQAGDNQVGEPYASSTPRLEFRRLRRAAGVPPIKLYSCRHTAATLMLRSVPVADVSYILGHARPDITYRVYAAHLPSHRKLAARAMDAALPGRQVDEGERRQPEMVKEWSIRT